MQFLVETTNAFYLAWYFQRTTESIMLEEKIMYHLNELMM